MNFTLTRDEFRLYGIFSSMVSEDNKFTFSTLEHAFNKDGVFVPKLSAGVFKCKRYRSPKFGYDVFIIENPPDFQGQPVTYIELHIGCFNNDSDGCVLIASRRGTMMVEDSRIAFERFMELQDGVDEFTLTVV